MKWAGGKGQLLQELQPYYPFERGVTKYAEPFVGGGAVLFDILSRYDVEEVYISDTNVELINAYRVIRDSVEDLIERLAQYQDDFLPLRREERREIYLARRERFNDLKTRGGGGEGVEKAALMIFLNRTCFNGLYRVNKKGLFNVPMGDYKKPVICDSPNLRAVSARLRRVDIVCGDYRQAADFIDGRTFAYFDPPYRPLTDTADFTAYTEAPFSDAEQIALAGFVHEMAERGARVVVSNSDPRNADAEDDFFDRIYAPHRIRRVSASRMINCNSEARGKISELLISNY